MNAKDLIATLALLAGLGAVWLIIEFSVEAFGPLVLVVSVVAIWTLLVLMVFKP